MARPTKRRRSNGSVTFLKKQKLWQYRYWVGDKRKAGTAKTKKEADALLNRKLVMVADGMITGKEMKLEEYASI